MTRRRGPEETEQESLLPRFHTTFVRFYLWNNATSFARRVCRFSFHARRDRKMERWLQIDEDRERNREERKSSLLSIKTASCLVMTKANASEKSERITIPSLDNDNAALDRLTGNRRRPACDEVYREIPQFLSVAVRHGKIQRTAS